MTPSIPRQYSGPERLPHLCDPAPLATARGATPRIKAKEVIKIGRKRVFGACSPPLRVSRHPHPGAVARTLRSGSRFSRPIPPAPRKPICAGRHGCWSVASVATGYIGRRPRPANARSNIIDVWGLIDIVICAERSVSAGQFVRITSTNWCGRKSALILKHFMSLSWGIE